MISRKEIVKTLKSVISDSLTPLIDSDYIYLDTPYYDNIGDVLIWEGTEQFLYTLPYRCLLKTSFFTFDFRPIDKKTVILLQGGGNFGDLWYGPHDFRKNIIYHYPDNKIIILPQTVYYISRKTLIKDAILFHAHKHLTICARDLFSYKLLKRNCFAKNIVCVPDMAFFIDQNTLLPSINNKTNLNLYLKRCDKELSEYNKTNKYIENSCDVHDWPTYEKEDTVLKHLQFLIDKKKDFDQYAEEVFRKHMVQTGVDFLSMYNNIYTTRLHACILSILLDKDVTMFNNSYGKNYYFYNSWLKNIQGVNLIGEQSNVLSIKDIICIVLSRMCVFFDEIGLWKKIKTLRHWGNYRRE